MRGGTRDNLREENLLATVEAIHTAGPDESVWPRAREAITNAFDAVGTTLKLLDEKRGGHLAYYFAGLPPAVLAIQHSANQDHVSKTEIALMRRLLPHVQQAFDVTRRLKRIGDTRQAFERTLDWLADGVALIGKDGVVLHANKSFQTLVRRKDGIRLKDNIIEFFDAATRDKFSAALASALRLGAAKVDTAPSADFAAARSGGQQPYLVSVRPLGGAGATIVGPKQPSQVAAIVFVRDPRMSGAAPIDTLRELFGFTEAEAALAQALQSGMTLNDYARRRGLSVNTVYTHLRRLREKTGCSRMPELIHKLNELRLPLRLD
jgi:DNA-binding CsgD family transcriptional regulator